MDSYEEMIIPEVPKALPNEQLFVYVPIASDDTPGVAKFDNEYFSVDTDGTVHLRSLGKSGIITIPASEWTTPVAPTQAFVRLGDEVFSKGSIIFILPNDDATKNAAVKAKMSVSISGTADGENNFGDFIMIIRAESGIAPTIPLNFLFVVFETGATYNAVPVLAGVDAYGETEEPISMDLSGFAPNENGEGRIVETYANGKTVVTELTYDESGRITKIGDTTIEWGKE